MKGYWLSHGQFLPTESKSNSGSVTALHNFVISLQDFPRVWKSSKGKQVSRHPGKYWWEIPRQTWNHGEERQKKVVRRHGSRCCFCFCEQLLSNDGLSARIKVNSYTSLSGLLTTGVCWVGNIMSAVITHWKIYYSVTLHSSDKYVLGICGPRWDTKMDNTKLLTAGEDKVRCIGVLRSNFWSECGESKVLS